MSSSQPTAAQIRQEANKKSPVIAYVLWFFLGGFAAHRFYAGRWQSALVWIALAVLAVVLIVMGLPPNVEGLSPEELAAQMSPLYMAGLAIYGVLLIWWIVDAFLIPGWIRRHNEELALDVRR